MAKTINTNIVNNTSEGYLIDAKNIKGGYFSVEGNPNNITDASKIPTDIKTAGSLCYDATNKKYYRYNPSSNKWDEEKMGGDGTDKNGNDIATTYLPLSGGKLTGQLYISKQSSTKTSPVQQDFVIENSGATSSNLTEKTAPGIGFHIANVNWANFIYDGTFKFLSNDFTTYAPVKASSFTGALKGNADTATKATQDGNGNNIVNTYATKSSIPTIATGSTSGTIKVTVNGSSTNVAVKGLLGAAYKNVDDGISLSTTSTNLPTSKAVAALVSSAMSSSGGSGSGLYYSQWSGNSWYNQGFICAQVNEITISGTTDIRILHSSGSNFSNASSIFLRNTWYLDQFSAMVPYTYGAGTDLDPQTDTYNAQVILPFTTTVYSSETYNSEPMYVGTVTGTIRYGYDKMPDMAYGIDLRDLVFNLKNASNGDTSVMSYATIAYNKVVNLSEDQYIVYGVS